jgi:lipopolysaccharide assembly outer membrane protein LptD (OstA)
LKTLSLWVWCFVPWVTVPATADLSLSLNSQVHIQADTIQFFRDQNLVICKGQVHIQQDQVHLYADTIRYDNVAQDVHAEGHVVWQDESQEVEAQTLDYNMKTGMGKAFNIKTTAPPWISTGSEIDIMPHKIVIKDAVTTTCDYPEGYRHYYMKADKITIFSGDYLVAENVVFFIGKVPVFYFPFFVRTIHDLQTPLSIETGATDYLGNYILLTSNYLLNPKSYGALYTDYFFKKGLGLGLHHEVALNDYQVLSLYGYGIQEKDDHLFRWEGRARMLWALSSNFQGRVEADLPGDGNFSNDYSVARRDPSLVSTVREFDISTTYTNPNYTLGLLLRRQEIANVINPDIINPNSAAPITYYSNFIESLQNLPQANFSLFPQPLLWKYGPKYDLSLQGDHTYTQADGFYVSHLTGELGLSQSLRIDQTQTLFGRAAMDESLQDVADQGITVGAGSAGETHSINLQSNWMSRWSEYVNSNFTYNFIQKLNNRYPTDPPTGVTTNFLSGRVECDVGSTLREATSSSFDFNAQVTNPLITTVAPKFGYLHQEVYWTASSQLDYTLIGDYSIAANGLQNLNSVLNIRSPHSMWLFRISGNYLNPNFTNQGPVTTGLPPTFEIAGEADFAFFTNYRLSLLETYDLTNSQFETRSISIYRDLHDWEAQVQYTEDPVQGKRLFFTLNLKAFPGRPLTVSEDQLQRLNGLRNQGLTGAASQFQ